MRRTHSSARSKSASRRWGWRSWIAARESSSPTRIVLRGDGGDRQPLTVVDAAKLRAGGKKSVLGEIQAGGFPREERVSTDVRTLFVTNFTSMTLEMIDVSRALPKTH
jgi:hypothetical protein